MLGTTARRTKIILCNSENGVLVTLFLLFLLNKKQKRKWSEENWIKFVLDAHKKTDRDKICFRILLVIYFWLRTFLMMESTSKSKVESFRSKVQDLKGNEKWPSSVFLSSYLSTMDPIHNLIHKSLLQT